MNRTHITVVAFVAICIGAFFAPFLLAPVSAQRVGYVERASDGAFASHLAPNPAASKMLVSLGTSNRVAWSDAPSGMPSGTPGQIPQIANTTGTYTYTATGTQTMMTGTQTTTTTEWKAVNGSIFAGSNVTLSKGTSTVTDTAVSMSDSPTIHAAATTNEPGGDLFFYNYSGCNTIAVFASPDTTMTGSDMSLTATTSPTYFAYSGTSAYYTALVNRFADDCSAASMPRAWVSPGTIRYSIPLKASSAVTTHVVFGLCTSHTALATTIQDVSISVTSSSWTTFTGSVSIPNGVLIPVNQTLCVGIYSQTPSGTATSYLGSTYTNQTKFNGPWIKSGANSYP